MASFVAVVAWSIELSHISSPGIALGGNLLFLEEAFNLSMTLVYTMVTFTLKLDFPLPLLCSERVCSFIFSSYSSDSSPKHIKRYRETISPSRSSTVIMIPLLLCTCFIPDFYIFGAAIMTFEHSSLLLIEDPWIFLAWFSISAITSNKSEGFSFYFGLFFDVSSLISDADSMSNLAKNHVEKSTSYAQLIQGTCHYMPWRDIQYICLCPFPHKGMP